ncbi:MAG: hypothetical protein NTV02_03930 [Candidatus Zambryskibacteria bacterium]|nr:hypothetical protein [Candidatus Zambryskibacteria bacterium]
MQQLIDSYNNSKDLHHAYVCVGDVESIFPNFENFLTDHLSFGIVGNPDYRVFVEPTLSIDTARALGVLQAQKNFSGERQIFVLKVGSIGEEAQNALLKIFEEPTPQTHFFVFIPQDTLLPTLRSRVRMLHQAQQEGIKTSFLKLSLPERLAYIKKITEDISDEKKTKQSAIELINQIETELYSDGGVAVHSFELALCEKARTALFPRGAMTKMLLEQVALSI